MHNSTGEGASKEFSGSFYIAPLGSGKTPQKLFYLLSGLRWGTADFVTKPVKKTFQTHPVHNSTGEGASKEFSGRFYIAPLGSGKTPQKLFYRLSGLRWGTADFLTKPVKKRSKHTPCTTPPGKVPARSSLVVFTLLR